MQDATRVEAAQAPEYVPFFATGERAVGEFHCSECGYGVSVQQRLPRCPMCSGEAWEPVGAGLRLQ
jgi:rubrerythrin